MLGVSGDACGALARSASSSGPFVAFRRSVRPGFSCEPAACRRPVHRLAPSGQRPVFPVAFPPRESKRNGVTLIGRSAPKPAPAGPRGECSGPFERAPRLGAAIGARRRRQGERRIVSDKFTGLQTKWRTCDGMASESRHPVLDPALGPGRPGLRNLRLGVQSSGAPLRVAPSSSRPLTRVPPRGKAAEVLSARAGVFPSATCCYSRNCLLSPALRTSRSAARGIESL